MAEHPIPPEQQEEFKLAYLLFSETILEPISSRELGQVMESLGQHATHAELEDMINQVDADGNGTIDFKEFVSLMQRNIQNHESEQEYQELFKIFDRSNNGRISQTDLTEVLRIIGEPHDQKTIQEIMTEADLDEDGYINYEEFVRMMAGKPQL